jgi:hypothetical protein
MQKTTTKLKKTDLFIQEQSAQDYNNMQPSNDTLQKILQFAATYRTCRIKNNQFVELFLN